MPDNFLSDAVTKINKILSLILRNSLVELTDMQADHCATVWAIIEKNKNMKGTHSTEERMFNSFV